MSTSKITFIGVAAAAILLIGAAVVFAQNGTGAYGSGMMGGFGARTAAPAQTAPAGNGAYGRGMMGNGYYGNGNGNYAPGMMGNGYYGNGNGNYGRGMMDNIDWNSMRDAMNSGNWSQMYQVCRDAFNNWQSQQGNGGGATAAPAAAPTAPGSTAAPAGTPRSVRSF